MSKKIHLHPGQTKLLKSKKRFTIASCGTGGGKSYCGPLWLAREISNFPGETWIVAAPTYRILAAATLPNLLEHYAGTNLEGNPVPTRGIYELPDGGKIWMVSMDSPNSCQGVVAAGAWYDEAGMGSEASWITLQQRTGFKTSLIGKDGSVGGKILITTTPYTDNWLREAVEKGRNNDPDYVSYCWPSIYNPYYPVAEYERAKRDLPFYLFNMRYNGVIGMPEHGVYSEFAEDNVRTCIYRPELPIIIGSDFNNSPMVWIMGHKVEDRLEIFDELVIKQNAKTHDAMDELFRRYCNHKNGFYFYGDATSKAERPAATESDYKIILNDTRFQALGRWVKYPAKNTGTENRVGCVNALIRNACGNRRLFVDNNCRHLINDIKQAEYIEGTRKLDKRPGHDRHGADALGYLCQGVFPLTIPTSPAIIHTRNFTRNNYDRIR